MYLINIGMACCSVDVMVMQQILELSLAMMGSMSHCMLRTQ
jgi:hypothetical protein